MRASVTGMAATALTLAIMAATGAIAYRQWTSQAPPSPTAGGLSVPSTMNGEPGFALTEVEKRQPLPDVSFIDGNGQEMTFGTFVGRTMLLNIWATWCVPCREEMPALDRLQQQLGGPTFEIVALSIDREGLPAVKAFYKELKLRALGIYVDPTGAAARQLRAVGIPTTLLVDRRGREIGRTVGPAEWDSEEIVKAVQQHLNDEAAGADQRTEVLQ